MSDLFTFMDMALEEARKSLSSSPPDVPVGCIIVRGDKILSAGHNTREKSKNTLGHAELNAISSACTKIGDWRLDGAEMFATLEPCPMCAGAIKAARISKLYFGAWDTAEGAAGSKYNLLYPSVKVYGGIHFDKCAAILEKFFADILRKDG